MNRRITIGLALLIAAGARAGFAPIPLTSDSYNADIIVEKNAPGVVLQVTTATMDGGTNNSGNTWYEMGYNLDALTTGIPAPGVPFTSAVTANRQYAFAPSYTNNNVILLDSSITNGTLTLVTPATYGAISVLTSGGNGGCQFKWTVHYADSTTESGTAASPDWFASATGDYNANGRMNNDFTFQNVNSGYPRLYARDFVLSKTSVAVKSIDLTYVSSASGAHTMFTCISGGASTSDSFAPIPVTGYNYDGIVEISAPHRGAMGAATTGTMDGGLGNTGATWYEQGLVPFAPTTGLPPAGSLLTNFNSTDHVYKLAPDYTAPNAIIIDGVTTYGVITPVTPGRYSALSFLAGSGGGAASISYTVHYADGSSDLNSFTVPDWYNGTAAFIANGRINVGDGIPDTINANNPRLYSVDIALSNASSPVTSIEFYWNSGTSTAHIAVLGLSGTAGAVKPIINPQPQSVLASAGDNVQLAPVVSGTAPFTFVWQKSFSSATNAVFTNLNDNAVVSGSKTTTLQFSGITVNDSANYQLIVHNAAGYVTSLVATVTVISPLQDVVTAGDPVVGFPVNWPSAESPDHAVDHSTSKYLNFGKDNSGFTVTPSIGLTIVSGMRFYTANDTVGRDPSSYKLEGSLDGVTYSLISAGALALPDARNAGSLALNPLSEAMQQVLFNNTNTYAAYKVTFPNVKDETANSMQIGEVEILGVVDTSGRPHFTALPSTVTIYQGGNATLSATAAGTPAPSYQWRRGTAGVYTDVVDGGNIAGAKTSTLTVTGAALTDGMDYVVVASNTAGSLTGGPIALNVLSSTPNILGLTDTVTSFGNATSDRNTDPTNAVDGTTSKYVNIGSNDNASFGPFIGPVGLIITPAAGATLVTGLRIFASDNNVITDPADYKLEGSTDGGASYTVISSGALNLPAPRNANGTNIIDPLIQANQEVRFANSATYTSYKITFAHVKDDQNANSMQIAELQLLGVPASEAPATLSIVNNGDGSVTVTASKPGELFSTTALKGASTTWADEGAIQTTLKLHIGQSAKFFRLTAQ